MDKNKLIQYVIANMGHVIHHAVNSLKASGKLPREAKASDYWEHGIHGLMQAIHNYDPNKGDLNAYAKKKIMGLIQEHGNADRNAFVPRSLETDSRETQRKQVGSQPQQTGVAESSKRAAVESAGGTMDESGGADLSTIKNYDRQFADKNAAHVGSDEFKNKMARYENKFGEKAPQETASIPAPSASPEVVPVAEKKPVVVRRPKMAPDQEVRLKAIDAAKTSQGKK